MTNTITQCLRLLVGFTALAACANSDPAPLATSTTTARAAAAVSAPETAAESCGKTGLPDCPLQGWMKASPQAYLKSLDFTRLAGSLDELAAHEPAGFDGWADSARRAAEAARHHDVEGVKAQCRNCHDTLRARFRKERRTVPLF